MGSLEGVKRDYQEMQEGIGNGAFEVNIGRLTLYEIIKRQEFELDNEDGDPAILHVPDTPPVVDGIEMVLPSTDTLEENMVLRAFKNAHEARLEA